MNSQQKIILNYTKDYVLIIFGIFLYALGFTAFVLPEKVVIGGVTGLSTIIYFKTGLPVAYSVYGINLALLAVAFKIVGKQFVWRTIFGTTVLSLMIGFMQPLFPEPLIQQQSFMNVLIGALMSGFGLGITFSNNGSTGGTDIVAAIFAKVSNVSMGRVMVYVDMFIILSSYLLHHSIEKVVFGYVVLVVAAMCADYVVNSNRQSVQFIIWSKKWDKIANAINNYANRGCTLLKGTGWYSKEDVNILLVLCRKSESILIFRIVKTIDREAFVTQSNVNGVYGRGFDGVKVRLGDEEQQLVIDKALSDQKNVGTRN